METSNGMNRTQIYISSVIIVAIIVIGAWQYSKVPMTLQQTLNESDTLTDGTPVATSSDAETPAQEPSVRTFSHPLPIMGGDNIASWDFNGAYTGNSELTAKAQTEINRLSDLLATATSSAMILSVGIANQYELIGNGKKQYEYLERAIRANAENGLPCHNLGVLMERLGAYKTARVAYEKSTLGQPEMKFYHYAYIEFLTSRMKEDTATIEKAFENAEKNIGQTPYLLELRAEWKKP